MRIAFLLPDLRMGGGNLVICQLAEELSRRGHSVTIVSCMKPPENPLTAGIGADVKLATLAEVADSEFDFAIATFWATAYELHRLRAARYAYFVQSLEHRFHKKANRLARSAARRTYTIGLPTITIADWIAGHLRKIAPAANVQVVRYGVDHTVFRPKPMPPSRPFRILVEGPPAVAIKNTDVALKLAKESTADEVWLLSVGGAEARDIPDRVFSGLGREEVARVMEQCHVLLKLSLVEGQPLPPIEMALIGRPSILSDLEPYREYLEEGTSAFLVDEPFRNGVLTAIARLKEDSGLLASMGVAARNAVAEWPSVPEAAAGFEAALLEIEAATGAGSKETERAHIARLGSWLERDFALSTLYGFKTRPLLFRVLFSIRQRFAKALALGADPQPQKKHYV